MATIVGVGVGVFVLTILMMISILACYLGGGSRYSNQISFGTTTLFLLVAVILLVSPRGESNKSVIETEIEGYDDTVTHRALMLASMLMAMFVAGGGIVFSHLSSPVFSKPVDHQIDVLSLEKKGGSADIR
mmetsp:Transcript_12061/g.43457  ORF Transcript_12061/g.43457 Transcript_12061/m.43457 type:complete len:131 (-) Transcript_12061:124-516(-)